MHPHGYDRIAVNCTTMMIKIKTYNNNMTRFENERFQNITTKSNKDKLEG